MTAATPSPSRSTDPERVHVPDSAPSPRLRARRGGALPVLVSAMWLFTHVALHARSDRGRGGDDKPVFRDVMGTFAARPVVKDAEGGRGDQGRRGQDTAKDGGRRGR